MIVDLAPKPILYFDGVCNLCNGYVQFIIKHDKKERFRFAPLQSAAGRVAAVSSMAKANEQESVILEYRGKYYRRSAAALHTMRLLGGGWALLYAFIIIPPFIRNGVYNLVARNRYKWFGRQDKCMVPTEALSARFISQ